MWSIRKRWDGGDNDGKDEVIEVKNGGVRSPAEDARLSENIRLPIRVSVSRRLKALEGGYSQFSGRNGRSKCFLRLVERIIGAWDAAPSTQKESGGWGRKRE
ncbi:hypothetical protein C8R43DRAFT_942645 [Mycena crocata]|nr:hypothetical protein C8R43DRAFT_942645 [Mycena crocata]